MDALTELVGPGNLALLFQPFTELPPGWREEFSGLGVQMVWNGDRRALEPVHPVAPGEPAPEVEVLGPDDVADMLDLVARTQPGPFLPRTHELGTYVGVRDPDDGRLLALAGQRLRPPGHVEISAVCTDPEAQGRGLARLLVAWLIDEIASSGDVPILHVAAHNTGAARLYRAMGFEATREMRYGAFASPAGRSIGPRIGAPRIAGHGSGHRVAPARSASVVGLDRVQLLLSEGGLPAVDGGGLPEASRPLPVVAGPSALGQALGGLRHPIQPLGLGLGLGGGLQARLGLASHVTTRR